MELIMLLIVALLGAILVLLLIYPMLVKKLRSGRAALYMSMGIYLTPLFITWGYLFEPDLMGIGYLLSALLSLAVIITGNLARHFATPLPETNTLINNASRRQPSILKAVSSLVPIGREVDSLPSKNKLHPTKPIKPTIKGNDF